MNLEDRKNNYFDFGADWILANEGIGKRGSKVVKKEAKPIQGFNMFGLRCWHLDVLCSALNLKKSHILCELLGEVYIFKRFALYKNSIEMNTFNILF